MSPDVAVFLVPIVAIIGAFATAIVGAVLRARERQHLHQERLLLLERGMEIPPQLFEQKEEKKPSDFRAARAWLIVLSMVLISIGVGTIIALGVREGVESAVNGVIPLLIGVGLWVAQRLLPRQPESR